MSIKLFHFQAEKPDRELQLTMIFVCSCSLRLWLSQIPQAFVSNYCCVVILGNLLSKVCPGLENLSFINWNNNNICYLARVISFIIIFSVNKWQILRPWADLWQHIPQHDNTAMIINKCLKGGCWGGDPANWNLLVPPWGIFRFLWNGARTKDALGMGTLGIGQFTGISLAT